MVRPRIAFLLQRSAADGLPSVSAVTDELVGRLRAEYGAEVDLLLPEDGLLQLGRLTATATHDLYVLKAKTPLTMAVAAAGEASGAVVVNSVQACTLTRDKLAATAVLAGAGVPTPPSWATGRIDLLSPVLACSPLWVKPQRGSHGVGIQRLAVGDNMARLEGLTEDVYGLPLPVFAQAEVPSAGLDLKVYVVGKRMWAISRCFPARTLKDKLGVPTPISAGVRQATLAAGAALGLELYGVDFVVDGQQFWAVDVNAFPGYKGVPEAPAALAEYLYGTATGRLGVAA